MMVESFALRRIRACRPGSAEDEGGPALDRIATTFGFALASRPTRLAFAPFLSTRRDNEMMKKRLDKPNPIRAGGSPMILERHSGRARPRARPVKFLEGVLPAGSTRHGIRCP